MSRPVSKPSDIRTRSLPRLLLGVLLLGGLSLWACDLSSPTAQWEDERYDHGELSGGYELVGPHAGATCDACHTTGNFAPLFQPEDNQDCQACHTADYQDAHGDLGYPTTCLLCHNGSSWPRTPFDHAAVSGGFELVGPHAAATCDACHAAGTFAPLFQPADNQDCYSCHAQDYELRHGNLGYPTDCMICHNGSTWPRSPFDHEVASGGFELIWPHYYFACSVCHDSATNEPLFEPKDEEDCSACHS